MPNAVVHFALRSDERQRAKRTVLPVCLVLVALLLSACAPTEPTTEPTSPSPPSPPQVSESEVMALLERYAEAFAKEGGEDAIRSLYVTDDRFSWYEDGSERYPTVDAILAQVSQMPPGMTFTTEYSETRVVPLTDGLAQVRTAFQTQLNSQDGGGFSFGGAITMLVEKSPEGWKILSGHTSSVRERPSPG